MNVNHQSASARGDRITCTPDIAIRVKNGTAIISGTACSPDEKLRAESAVNAIGGVSKVYNLVKTSDDV